MLAVPPEIKSNVVSETLGFREDPASNGVPLKHQPQTAVPPPASVIPEPVKKKNSLSPPKLVKMGRTV
jgi:hypothetical protein